MLAIATFWLLLCLPGYACLRRFCPSALEGGLLSSVALGYLASFALLSSVSIAGYLFRLPLAVLSSAIVAAVAIAGIWLVRELVRSWPWRWPRPQPLALLAFALITLDMVLGLRAGTYFRGDANYHLARVRMLLSFGFNSWDPMAPGPHFDTTYHSNLYHALIAAAAQFSGQHAIDGWGYTWFWAKLMAASATYHLAWVMLGQRWLAWSAACLFAIFMAPSSVLTYPNTLAVFGLLPLVLAFMVQAWTGKLSFIPALGLGASAVVLVEFHALYYIFACLLAGPVLLVGIVRLQLRRLPGRPEMLAALLALGLGAPWFAVRAWPDFPARRAPPAAAAPVAAATIATQTAKPEFPEPAWSYKGFVRLDHGRIALDPASLKDPRSQHCQLLLALLAGTLSRRRQQFFALSLAIAIVITVLYVPAVCTAADHLIGAAWVVRRLSAVLTATHLALVPGVLGLLIAERLPSGTYWAWHGLLRLLAFCAAIAYGYDYGVNSGPWTRPRYLAAARSGTAVRAQSTGHARIRQFFSQNIPRGATVAVSKAGLNILIVDCDCFPLSLPVARGSHGVADMDERRAALAQLFDARHPLPPRVETLRRYRVRHLFGRRFSPAVIRVYGPITLRIAKLGTDQIIVVDPRRLP